MRTRATSSLRGERLDHIVVGAELQAGHPIGLFDPCREEDHGEVAVPSYVVQHFEAGHRGQHEVEDDEIGPELHQPSSSGFAVYRRLDLVSVAAQVIGDNLPDPRLVVDNQDSLSAGIGE